MAAADTEVAAADTEAADTEEAAAAAMAVETAMEAEAAATVAVPAAMEAAATTVAAAAATVAVDIEKRPPSSGIHQITCIGIFRRAHPFTSHEDTRAIKRPSQNAVLY